MLTAAALAAHAQKTLLKPTTRQVVLELARDVPWQKTTRFTQLILKFRPILLYQLRQIDVKDNWDTIPSEELQRCHSSLSFFDADGMRFHLPAFIVGSLKNEVDDPIFHLTHLSEYAESQFTSLNKEQVSAIVNYLNWCLETPEYQHERPMIEKALNGYWAIKK